MGAHPTARLMNMFSVPLLAIDCKGWPHKRRELLDMMGSLPEERSIKTDFNQQNSKREWDHNQKLQALFADELSVFCKVIGAAEASVTSSWFEQGEFGMSHAIHNHGPVGYSAVCYIDFEQGQHTPTKFVAPFLNFFNGSSLHHEVQDAKEGLIVFFPSSILHYTEPNRSQKPRTVMSFNLTLKV
jgi:hypothetical protein